MRRSTRSRFAVILTLTALAASLGASAAAPALARDGDSGRRMVIENRPGRETGANRPIRTVDVSKLQPASGEQRAYEPSLMRPALRSPSEPRTPAGVSVASPPVQITAWTGAPAAVESTAFPGLSSGTIEPPDPWVAVGPEHVVQSVNTTIRITDRQGGGGINYSMEQFFGNSSYVGYQAEVFDPRIIYDSLHGRWIGVEASFDCYEDPANGIHVGTGYLDIAISESPNAGGLWEIGSIPFTDAVPDYPAIGTSTDKVVLSSNVFALTNGGGAYGCDINDPFLGTELDVIAWSELIGTGDVTPQYFTFGNAIPSYFSWRPALQTPATSATVYLVAENNPGNVAYAQITGNPDGGSGAVISPIIDLATADVVQGFEMPPPPKQPGSPPTIADAVDERPTDAVWQNNKLAFVSTYPCDPAGGLPETRDCVRVTELLTTSSPPARVQDFLIGEDGADHYMGGIGYAGNGDLHVVWTRSSENPGQYASSYAAHQLVTDPPNSLSAPHPLALGTGTYTGVRWGDYVGVAQDPQVPNAVWQANQYADSTLWGTRVSQLQTGGSSYVPIAPKRVVDSRFNLGVTGAFAVNVPKTFQVGGVAPIPAQAIAVTGNVTVVGQTAAGYVSITPTATATPSSSTMNFPLGDIRANNFTVPLDAAGRLAAVYKASTAGQQTHVIVDITGYFLPGPEDATYATIDPVRLMDTRPVPFHVGPISQFTAGQINTLHVAGTFTIPADATAITGNVTVVGQTAAGLLAVTPDPPTLPLASSTLNFPVGDTRANGLTADLNSSGDLSITFVSNTAGAKAHVLLDVTGYYRAGPGGLLFYPLNPGRIMDSRPGVVLSGLSGVFNTSVPRELPVAGHWGAAAGADAITGNLTVVSQTSAGFVSITPTPNAVPTTSTLNFPLGDIRANGVTVPVNGLGTLWLVYKTTTAGQRTHLILDMTGYFN
jgi:hypothetical protein